MDHDIDNTDVGTLADEVRRTHGSEAFDYAARTAKHHLLTAAWKSGALWLKVVNRLKTEEPAAQKYPNRIPIGH